PADRVLQLPALTFDASVRDLLGPLAAGAAVVLVDMEQAKDPAALLETMERRRVTRLLSVVPTMLRGLLDATPTAGVPRTLCQVLVSGERLYLADCARARELFGPELSIVNQYGATECTMTSSYHPVGRAGRAEAPLGRPIPNSRFYVLRESGVLAPPGSFGELHIGGVGLARGYLGRPDLTAAAFRPDPFSGVAGARLYGMGDLVRHLADGTLELRGRLDHQVKLRGFRVELGEVEEALLECPGVRAAAVTMREGTSLVAHVVPDLDAATLRSELESRLPAYMVPASFLFLERLPLTPHGKVDRKALERTAVRSSGRVYVAPRTPVEERLAGLFAEVLAVERVGASDSFFDLGGHSLLAVRLIAEIRRRFGRDLPLSVLFEKGTVEALARLLSGGPETRPWSPLVSIQTGGSRLPFFCVHPAGGNVLCYEALARQLGPDQPFYGLQAAGLEDGVELCGSVGEMADRYLAALREVQPIGPYQLGGWSFGGVVAFEMARRLRDLGEEVLLLALLDTTPPTRRIAVDDEGMFLRFAHALAEGAGKDFAGLSEEVLRRAPDERLGFLVEQGKQAGFLPPDTGLSEVRRFMDVFQGNIAAGRAYIPGVYPEGLVLFRAVDRSASADDDGVLGWSVLAEGGVEVCDVQGNHRTMLLEPNLAALARALEQRLARPAGEQLEPAPDTALWTRPQLETALAGQLLPEWAAEAYGTFKAKVLDPRFPCTFGIVAQQRGTLLYAFARSLEDQTDRLHIQSSITEYLGRVKALAREESALTLLVLFVDPRSLPPELEAHHHAVWDLLQFLHEEDDSPWAPGVPTDPDHPLWSFCLGESPIFVNISSPAHRQRQSRNLGSALTLIIQLREGFDLIAPDTPTGRRVRETIRNRTESFDGTPTYPELGYYQDPRNREWKQYGIPDGNQSRPARCPFHTRKE
ncbi:MAG TPA: YqcI/YcgG family protein, partial [Thermoanaerobaculia bacterium]|nr:YqcI/YcgG family protein [Thermoanaerobaculia bacterium]